MDTGMGTAMAMDMEMKNSRLAFAAVLGIGVSSYHPVVAQQSVGLGAPPTSATAPLPNAANSMASALGNDNPSRTWNIKPRISLKETITDNANVNRNSGNNNVEFITEISPGIRIDTRTSRLKASLDYSLNGQFYARDSGNNRSQNSLNASGTFEAIDQWLFLDFGGYIAQQSISAFGSQSPSNATINSNQTETANYRISPNIRGQLAGLVDYSLRYSISTTQSDASAVSDIDLSQWSGNVRGATPLQKLNWSVDATQQTADYSRGRKVDAELLRGILTYAVFPDFRISLSAGREANNYASQDQTTNSTHGYGFDWNPTERSKFSVFKEKRFFGNGHNIHLNHRFPMSSIQFSDVKDVSILPNQFSNVGLGSAFDLYFRQFASLIPDEAARTNFVNALLSQNGIDPNLQVVSGFLSSQATLRRNQQFSWVLFGVRNSITLLANRSENQGLQTGQTAFDTFSQASKIKQQGFGLNFSHKLTALTNLNLLGSWQESLGSGTSSLKTTTSLYQANLSSKLGAKTTGSLSLRRTEFEGTNPYSENAVLGAVSFVY